MQVDHMKECSMSDVINRIMFLNEHLGVLEVPPQTLLEIGEDALEIVIGNEVGEKT